MDKMKLEAILPVLLNQFSLNLNDVDVSLIGPELDTNYTELQIDFYFWDNKFELVYIHNQEKHYLELFHADNANILYQKRVISPQRTLSKHLIKAKEILDNYHDFKDYPLVRISDIEKSKITQKIKGGMWIGNKYINFRGKK